MSALSEEPQGEVLRKDALQHEQSTQIRQAREHHEVANVQASPAVVQLGELKEAMPKSHSISVGDKVALWSMRLEQQATAAPKEGKWDDISNLAGEHAHIETSTNDGGTTKASDVLGVLIEMEQTVAAERRSKDEMVASFEELLQEAASKHASEVFALQSRLSEEKQRSANAAEMRHEMEKSHARDIAVLEGMVQRALEENERLAIDAKAWKAAASRRRSSNSTNSSTVSTGTSSGDESGGTRSGDDSSRASPELAILTPPKVKDVSSSDGSNRGSPEIAARMPVLLPSKIHDVSSSDGSNRGSPELVARMPFV